MGTTCVLIHTKRLRERGAGRGQETGRACRPPLPSSPAPQDARRAVGPLRAGLAGAAAAGRGFVGRGQGDTGWAWLEESGGLSPGAGKGCSAPTAHPLELGVPSLLCVPPPPAPVATGAAVSHGGDAAAPRTGQASRGLRPHRPRRPTRPGSRVRGACQWPAGSRGAISSPTPGWLRANLEPAVGPRNSSCHWARVLATSEGPCAPGGPPAACGTRSGARGAVPSSANTQLCPRWGPLRPAPQPIIGRWLAQTR